MAMKLYGPFRQILTFKDTASKGAIKDDEIDIITDGGILVENGVIVAVDAYIPMMAQARGMNVDVVELEDAQVAMPALIDAHTHICYGGHRARDYALRNSGKTYVEILESGGGIMDTVRHTRDTSIDDLTDGIVHRAHELMKGGISTIEIKSGYGLTVEEELKMLKAIKAASDDLPCQIIATCLAAHIVPSEYKKEPETYVKIICEQLLPEVHRLSLASRVDAFIEPSAFTPELITPYLDKAQELGFDITLHGDQFTVGGSKLAARYRAVSCDHLEASTDQEVALLAQSDVIPVVLPGASIGLGCDFAPARKLLDAGCSLAIASDYNPGSAPMGDLLTQASIIGAFQKLSNAEVLAGITFRAGLALGYNNIGKIAKGYKANICTFDTNDFQHICYRQGRLRPNHLLIEGKSIY